MKTCSSTSALSRSRKALFADLGIVAIYARLASPKHFHMTLEFLIFSWLFSNFFERPKMLMLKVPVEKNKVVDFRHDAWTPQKHEFTFGNGHMSTRTTEGENASLAHIAVSAH